MAGSSPARLCSDEELQKARDDMKRLMARTPIRDEYKYPSKEEKNKKEGKEKKKKMRVMPQEEVERLLNLQCSPIPDFSAIAKFAEEDEERFGYHKTLVQVTTVFIKHVQDLVHAAQEKLRREIETKGYYAYEVTDDEAEDDDGGAMASGGKRSGNGGGVRKLANKCFKPPKTR